jgi:hypothetical protein
VLARFQHEVERIAFCLDGVAQWFWLAAIQNPLTSVSMEYRAETFNLSSEFPNVG